MNSDLTKANFSGSELYTVNLYKANLSRALFQDAGIRGVYLEDAHEVNLEGAIIAE